MKYDLDLTQSAFTKARGDLTLYGCWHGRHLRPCLVVFPTYSTGVPLVIEIDTAWQWDMDDKDVDPRRNARLVGEFLAANGMDFTNVFTCMRVVSLIHDHLGDLLMMPPKPSEIIVVADALQTDSDTGKTIHREIIQRV